VRAVFKVEADAGQVCSSKNLRSDGPFLTIQTHTYAATSRQELRKAVQGGARRLLQSKLKLKMSFLQMKFQS